MVRRSRIPTLLRLATAVKSVKGIKLPLREYTVACKHHGRGACMSRTSAR
jgi:hypothetical protein